MQNTLLSSKIGVYAIPGVLSNKTPGTIIHFVEGSTGINISEKTRRREVVEARQIAMYAIKYRTRLSLAQIGAICGGKDHATVLHACKTVQNLLDSKNKEYLRAYSSIFEFYGFLETA
jgi:chromosomal replication initiation ATPase DnaA